MQTTRPALYDYLSRIVAVLLTETKPDPEERNLMLANVWGEISGGVLDLAMDKESSPLLETLISHSDCNHLGSFLAVLNRERRDSLALLDLIFNPFGSFVVDSFFWRILQLSKDKTKMKGMHCVGCTKKKLISMLTTFNDILLQVPSYDLRAAAQDRYAALSLRHFLQIMTGTEPCPAFKQQQKQPGVVVADLVTKISDPSLVIAATSFMRSLLDKIQEDDPSVEEAQKVASNLADLSKNQYGSLLVQEFLKLSVSVKDESLMDRIICSIIGDITNTLTFSEFSARNMRAMINDKSGSRLVEELFAVLVTKRPALYNSFYNECLKGRLVQLCQHHSANFVVQKLIQRLPLPSERDIEKGTWKRLEDIVLELAPNFESFVDRTMGVINSVVAAAAKLSNKSDIPPKCQTLVWEGLLGAISKKSNTDEEGAKKNICNFLIFHKSGARAPKPQRRRREPQEGEEGQAPPPPPPQPEYEARFSPLGCEILASLWQFDRAYADIVCESFVNLDVDTLSFLGKDSRGSRVIEAFFMSKAVKLKHKNKLFTILKGHWGDLACNKFGSFCFQKCYDVVSEKQKEVMILELLDVISDLSSNYFGKILVDHCQVSLFQNNKRAWQKATKQAVTRKKQFEEIFEAEKKKDKKRTRGKKGGAEKSESTEEPKEQKKSEKGRKRKRGDEQDDKQEKSEVAKKQKVEKVEEDKKEPKKRTTKEEGEEKSSKKSKKHRKSTGDDKKESSRKASVPSVDPNILASLGFKGGKLI